MSYSNYMDPTTTFSIKDSNTNDSSTNPEVIVEAPNIVLLIWTIFCIIPNLLLICIFIKYQLLKSNFYFILGHWSFANILQMADVIYIGTVAQLYPLYQIPRTLEVLHWIFSTLPITFALVLIFDFFFNSERSCRYVVYNIWVSAFINSGLTIVGITFGFFLESITVIGVVIIGTLSILILIIRTIIFCIRSSDERRYPLRLAISSLCILTNFTLAIYLVTRYAALDVDASFYYIVRFLTHTNGFVNVLLLVNLDQIIKLKFCQIFGFKRNQSNIQFSVKKAVEGENEYTNSSGKINA